MCCVCSDDGGIYKRRVNHRDYAEEIDDNRETKVDLPVDYREVETVDDENLYSNIGVSSINSSSLSSRWIRISQRNNSFFNKQLIAYQRTF